MQEFWEAESKYQYLFSGVRESAKEGGWAS